MINARLRSSQQPVWFSLIGLCATILVVCSVQAAAQTTATYRLHQEASTTGGRLQLKPVNPDSTASTLQTADLKAASTGEKAIKEFDTQNGVPNQAGRIASGATVTFSLWMRKTAAFGILYPRAKLLLNGSAGAALCTATGTTALTTTLAKYTLSCATSANVTMGATDKFYVWTGVNLTAGDAANSFKGELSIEGVTDGNYDSKVTVPLPAAPPIQYTYDELGRLVAVTDPSSDTATYNYDAVGNLTGINRQSSSNLSIVEFTPNKGAVGTAVTISGTGFSTTASQNTVKFNGTTATVVSATATQIVATVPIGATTGAITVTRSAVTATSAAAFTVGDPTAPTITGFTPNVGAAGSAVTVTGTNFQPSAASNKVAFSGVLSSIASATATSLGVAVPSGAGSGRISVTTPYGRAVSSSDFFVPPSPYTGNDVDSTGRIAFGETKTVSVATTNKIVMLLFDAAAGQKISLSISGNTIPSSTSILIYKPDGALLANTSAPQNGSGFIDAQTAPLSGTYTIVVDPASTSVGNITLKLDEVVDATSAITAGGAPVTTTTTTPGQNARLTFTGSFGQRVSLDLSGNTIPSTTYVRLLKPDGSELISTNIAQNATRFIDTQTLPTPGTYTILVDPSSTNTGSITVRLNDASVVAGAITAGGAPVTVTTAVPGQSARLTFSGTAGGRVSLSVTGVTTTGTYIYLQNPDNSQLAYIYSGTGGAFLDVQTLPATGTYNILVDPSDISTGSATLQLYSVPAEDAGTITAGGAAVTVTSAVPGHNRRLTFTGSFGQRISLDLSANTTPGTTYVRVFKPDGVELTSTSISQNGTRFIDTQVLPTPGTYTILVDPQGINTGSLTVKLNDAVDASAGSIVIGGAAVTVTTTQPGQSARVTFSGTAGGRISLNITGVTITSGSVSILNPNGTQLASAGFGTSGGFLDVQTLPATGTYTILVDPSSTYTGTAALQLYNVPAENAGAITPGGAAVTVTSAVPGHNRRLTFTGTFGQRVSLNLSANTTPSTTYVRVIKPDGGELTSTSISQNYTRFIDTQTLPMPGTYTILADPSGANTGSLTVQLNNAADASASSIIAGGAAVTVTAASAGQNPRLTFSGTAGQRVSLNLTSVTIASGTVAIYNPNGTALASVGFSTSGAFVDALTLPATGTYLIVLDPSGESVGNATLQLYNVPPDAIGSMTPGGTPVTATTTTPGQNARLTFTGVYGQRVSVSLSANTISGSTPVRLLKPDGGILVSANVSLNGTAYLDTQTLPVAGTYTILVDPPNINTGSLNVQLNNATDVATGIITAGGAAITASVAQAGQSSRLTFNGTAGGRVSLRMTGVTIPSGSVSLWAPSGTQLASVGFSTSGAFLDAQTLPTSGTYTIYVDPSGNSTGSAALQLYNVPANATSTLSVGGSAASLTTTIFGQNGNLTFAGMAGQMVVVRITGNTMSSVRISLHDVNGVELTYASSSAVTFNTNVATLPVSGTYTIKVDPNGINTGSISVSVTNEGMGTPGVADVVTTITAGGSPVTVTTTQANQNARLTFTGTFGQRVSLNLSANTIPSTTYVYLLKPDGTTLTSSYVSQNGTRFVETQTLPTPGTYTILVDPSATNTGSLTVRLNNATDATTAITAGGAAVTLTTARPGQSAYATFSGTANQRVSLNVTGVTIAGSYISLVDPNNSQLAYVYVGTGGAFIDALTLPVTGTYSIVLDPSGESVGSATLQLYNVPADSTTAITPGGAAVTVTATTPGQNARLTFSGAFGQRVSLDLGANTTPGTTYVRLLKPDGGELTYTSISQNGTRFIETQTLPMPGIYTILVDPNSVNTGSLSVQLNNAAETTGTIAVGGAAVTITAAAAGQNARLTFSGTVNQRVSLNITGVTIPSSYVSIYNPDGSALVANGSVGTGGAFVDTFTLPATGTYTILIDPQSNYTGSATLQLYNVPAEDAGTITAGGAAVTVTSTVPGHNRRLTFAGTFGQRVSLDLTGNTIASTTYVRLLKPDGSELTYASISQNNTRFIDTQTLPMPGTYTILVDPSSANTGSLTVKLNNAADVSAGTITAGGAAVTVTTTAPGQSARLTFSGTANQRVSLNITGVTIAGAYVYLQNPDNSQLASVYVGTGGAFLDVQTLPATGTYVILVDPSSTSTGSITLQLYNVPSDNAGAITAGTPVTVTSTVPGHNRRLTFTGTFGQRVSVNFSANTAPGTTYLKVFKPDGSELTNTSISQNGTRFIDTQTLLAAGTYTILVDPSGTNTGSLTVGLNDAAEVDAGALTINGAAVTVITTAPGQSAGLTFSGTAGEQPLTARIRNSTLGSATISVINPDGSLLASSSFSAADFNLMIPPLPTTGTFTIRIDPSGTNTGNLNLSLTNP